MESMNIHVLYVHFVVSKNIKETAFAALSVDNSFSSAEHVTTVLRQKEAFPGKHYCV